MSGNIKYWQGKVKTEEFMKEGNNILDGIVIRNEVLCRYTVNQIYKNL